jgi:hypothetical protein
MPLKTSLASRHVKLKQPVHPVVRAALDRLKGGGRGRAYSLEPADVSAVREQLFGLGSPEEMRTAMKGLLELGFFLATCQASPSAGHALAQLARDTAKRLAPQPVLVASNDSLPVPAKRVMPMEPTSSRARSL